MGKLLIIYNELTPHHQQAARYELTYFHIQMSYVVSAHRYTNILKWPASENVHITEIKQKIQINK